MSLKLDSFPLYLIDKGFDKPYEFISLEDISPTETNSGHFLISPAISWYDYIVPKLSHMIEVLELLITIFRWHNNNNNYIYIYIYNEKLFLRRIVQKDGGMEKKFRNWMDLAELTGDAMQSLLWIGEHERILPTYVTACGPQSPQMNFLSFSPEVR